MKQKFYIICAILSFLFILGVAGNSDTTNMSLNVVIVRSIIGLVIFALSCFKAMLCEYNQQHEQISKNIQAKHLYKNIGYLINQTIIK